MKYAAQRWFSEVGESACYALSIIALAEPFARRPYSIGDVALFLENAILKKQIHYDPHNPNDPSNFLVEAPGDFLADLIGGAWEVKKITENPSSYVPSDNELVIYRYKRTTPKGVYYHFCTKTFDPLGESLTRTQGELDALRVFRRV